MILANAHAFTSPGCSQYSSNGTKALDALSGHGSASVCSPKGGYCLFFYKLVSGCVKYLVPSPSSKYHLNHY